MKSRALKVFEDALAGWVLAWKRDKRYAAGAGDVASVLANLHKSLGADVLRRIGAGYIRGFLADVPDSYRVRVKSGDGPGFPMLSNASAPAPEVIPCKEMFVQLSEYVTLATMQAAFDNVTIGIERAYEAGSKRAMDLTVELDRRLVAYVEVKTNVAGAEKLCREFCRALQAPIRDRPVAVEPGAVAFTDGEKKADYIVVAATEHDLAAVGDLAHGELIFVVRASGGDDEPIFERWMLLEVDAPSRRIKPARGGDAVFRRRDEPLASTIEKMLVPERAPQADLAWRLERRFPTLWLGRSVKDKGFNLYLGTETGDHILFGLMADGRVYSQFAALGADGKARLSVALGAAGFGLGAGKDWSYWTNAANQPLLLNDDVAQAILNAVAPAVLA